MKILLLLVAIVAGGSAGERASAAPVTYTGTVVTDVKLGARSYHNAAVTITFSGDTRDIVPVVDSSGTPVPSADCPADFNPAFSGSLPTGPYFFWLQKGTGSVRIRSNGVNHDADFLPGQIFMSFDTCNAGLGFGSYVGPGGVAPAYPLAYTGGTTMAFLFNSTNPFGTSVNLAGNAWSCVNFPGNECLPSDSYPLHTSAGDFSIFTPYTKQPYTGLLSPHTGSINVGTFSIVIHRPDH